MIMMMMIAYNKVVKRWIKWLKHLSFTLCSHLDNGSRANGHTGLNIKGTIAIHFVASMSITTAHVDSVTGRVRL